MGGASLWTLCLVGAIALLSKLLGTSSIGFSIAVQQDAGNKSSAASPGRPRMGSRFYTSAAGQSSTDYGLTKGESKLLAKVVQAANRSDWQRIRQLRATSKVQKTPFFDVEMNAALACGQYKAGTALYEQLCKLKLPKEVLTFNLATKLYGKAGMWASVRQVWKEARKSYRMDETMAAARLVAAADEGDIRTAADILDEMVRMDLVVDVGHFTSALRACATAENSGHHAAVYLFDTLLNMSLTPDVQVFTALVSTFAGRPVSKFQKLRSQMDQFGVKHNWVFADAYLKALLVVPQKDKQSSVVELVDLMRGLSKERLREAASALSSFKTLKDEWSAFCEVTESALKRQGIRL